MRNSDIRIVLPCIFCGGHLVLQAARPGKQFTALIDCPICLGTDRFDNTLAQFLRAEPPTPP